jgi:hypothetical protein
MSDESLLANFGERPFHEETKTTFPKALVKQPRDADAMRAAARGFARYSQTRMDQFRLLGWSVHYDRIGN